MIIGINGKIGSGKDTVGKIIQWLTKPELDGQYIGFQTYDDHTLEKLSPFKIKKFAGKLKQIASLLTGIDVEKFEDQEFKKTNLSDEWSSLQQSGRSKVWLPMTVRELLQKLGTEAMRDGLHPNVWVNALFADYHGHTPKAHDLKDFSEVYVHPACSMCGKKFYGYKRQHQCKQCIEENSPFYPNWIITDMRFPNEMEAVVEKNGITIRVVRDYALRGGPEDPKNLHPSETALDGHTMHYEIINDGTIEDLIEKVRTILIKENII